MVPVKSKNLYKQEEQIAESRFQARRRAREKAKAVVKDQLALICSVGGYKRVFNLYPMPQETKQTKTKQKEIMAIELLKP